MHDAATPTLRIFEASVANFRGLGARGRTGTNEEATQPRRGVRHISSPTPQHIELRARFHCGPTTAAFQIGKDFDQHRPAGRRPRPARAPRRRRQLCHCRAVLLVLYRHLERCSSVLENGGERLLPYPALAPFFPAVRQRAEILTTLASNVMTAFALPVMRDYLTMGGVQGVESRVWSVGVNRFFQVHSPIYSAGVGAHRAQGIAALCAGCSPMLRPRVAMDAKLRPDPQLSGAVRLRTLMRNAECVDDQNCRWPMRSTHERDPGLGRRITHV
ncbi:hypothetical protein K438DRAFT_1992202 [Mycena galopus ATCC 62051]|nr:hypothetical protein K438DRAFT_1992202 [Mycena galopus ATCC 62051]